MAPSQEARLARAGFTLIELLAVMAILALLSAAFIFSFRKFQRLGEENDTRTRIETIQGAITGGYEIATGDFPPDDFEGLGAKPPNDLNLGSESLVAALCSKTGSFGSLEAKHLCNTDEDNFAKKITKFDTTEAFELVDYWGNPIAYFHCKHYGRKQKYLAKPRDTRVLEEQIVEAIRDPKLKGFFKSDSFQLISAGPDGRFGTADDIANFEIPQP